jgi:phage gp16-like protein
MSMTEIAPGVRVGTREAEPAKKRKARPARSADDLRRAEIAQIKIGAKQLALEDDAYRDMLFALARVRSAADLDWTGRKRVIEHLKSCGATVGKQRKRRDAQAEKIKALWDALAQAGVVRDGSAAALSQWLKRQTRVSAAEWMSSAEASRAIEALKNWAVRAGVEIQR